MRTWFALCVALTGALVALQLAAMKAETCSFGHHANFGSVEPSSLAPYSPIPIGLLDGSNPELDRLIEGIKPGEAVERKRTSSQLPVLREVVYDVATLSRDGHEIAVYKFGEVRFFAAFSAVAAFPLALFGVAVALLRLGPERRDPIS